MQNINSWSKPLLSLKVTSRTLYDLFATQTMNFHQGFAYQSFVQDKLWKKPARDGRQQIITCQMRRFCEGNFKQKKVTARRKRA